MIRALAISALALLLSACATTGANHPETTPFAATSAPENARSALAAAEARASAEGKLLMLIVYGANWCHDSRALAGWLETPRFKELTDTQYEVVYIDAGVPQKDEAKNLDLIAEYGLTDIEGTPNLLVVELPGKTLLNADTAKSWRDAASRSEDAIYYELASFAPRSATAAQ